MATKDQETEVRAQRRRRQLLAMAEQNELQARRDQGRDAESAAERAELRREQLYQMSQERHGQRSAATVETLKETLARPKVSRADAQPASEPLPEESSAQAESRRHELFDLREAQRIAAEANKGVAPTKEALQQDKELQRFIKALLEKKDERKYQLSVVKGFLEDPLSFGIKTEGIPSSSTVEEIEARRQELQYRADLLRTLLEMTEGEMQLLDATEVASEPEPTSTEPETPTRVGGGSA